MTHWRLTTTTGVLAHLVLLAIVAAPQASTQHTAPTTGEPLFIALAPDPTHPDHDPASTSSESPAPKGPTVEVLNAKLQENDYELRSLRDKVETVTGRMNILILIRAIYILHYDGI